ncbi:hypothetical protein HIM_08690 [Hirsutella minnesotensis 3608]|uniref:Major facilitator superfamily (MFS) profile domain-containing protein n=1 Tax=Hirsutella minnesotensis 3608 TaxID=1043627 RepID=A0A0F8A3J4_9HYPO|nr:hypothetical protein HIM_08690 [Hirsutella minnesotensis 3608]
MASSPVDETSPLLRTGDDEDNPRAGHGPEPLTTSRRLSIAVPCLLLMLAAEIGSNLLTVPMSQIAEGIICRRLYPDVGSETWEDARCKNSTVQAELSMLQGWEITFGLIPGLVTAIPYGLLADKYGRKAILCLSITGMILAQITDIVIYTRPDVFALRLIWLGSLWTFLGGGPFVYSAMIYTMANDVSVEAQRSTTFLYLAAATVGAELASGPLTYIAMRQGGAWLSVYIGLALLFIAALLAFAFPETRQLKVGGTNIESRNEPLDNSRPSIWARLSQGISIVTSSTRYLFFDNITLGLLLFSLVFTTLGRYVSIILLQYTTKRFRWSWSEAGLLSSISATVNLSLTAAILPALSQVLMRKIRLSALAKDLVLVRTGITALILGALGIGLARSSITLVIGVVIYALGSGYAPAMRGLLVQMAGEEHIGTLFTAMSVLESIGVLTAGPMMAAAFRLGLGWGDAWIGLPFILASCLLGCAAVVVFGVSTSKPWYQQPATTTNADS